MLSDQDRKEIEAGQRALYWARKNSGGPVRSGPKRDTQLPNYGFIDGLMNAREPYPWRDPEPQPQPQPKAKPAAKREPKKTKPVELIKSYPSFILAGKRGNFGGAVRLFVTAKHYDQAGRGVIEEKPFRQYVKERGVSDRSFRNWLNDACDLGLFVQWHDDKHKYNLISLEKAAATLGLFHLDRQPVTMPIKHLFKKGWHVKVWKAYKKANFQGCNISQDTLYKLTATPPSTQRLWNKRAGISQRRNIAVSTIPADNLASYQDYGDRPGLFVFNDPAQAGKGEKFKKVLAWTVPNTTRVNARDIQPAHHGRARTVKTALQSIQIQRLSKFEIIPNEQDPRQAQDVRRLFCENDGEYKATIRQRRKDQDPADIYLKRKFKRKYAAVGVYSAC